MSLRKFVFIFTLFLVFAGAAQAQMPSDATIVTLTVDEGFPLQVILTEKVRFKENEPVHGRIIEPVYAFDREVIPPGSEVLGKITEFRKAGKWKRFFSMLGGNFTPLKQPLIVFDTLVLPGGTRIPIETSVAGGAEKFILSDGIKAPGKDSQSVSAFTVKESGGERVKNFLWNLSPYRPQSLPVGTRFKAVLLAPLDFGRVSLSSQELVEIGAQPPAGSVVSARLLTPLDSGVSEPGTPVEALLARPLFSAGHQLLFPVGSRLRGEVLDVTAARMWHRNAELAFKFTTIELPAGLASRMPETRNVDGNLVGIQVAEDMDDVRVNEEGETRISESKMRFIAPAYALVKAGREINDTADPFDRALVGAYQSKATKQITGKDPGLGLAGSISGAMVPPVGIGLGVYGAARSIYSNFIGRGQDIRLPADTPVEIELR